MSHSSSPDAGRIAPPLSAGLNFRLSMMMFLQYAIWGAWLPLLYPFLLSYHGFQGYQIGNMFTVAALGAIVAPFIAGQIADRYFATEKFLGLSHLLGAVLVWQLSWINTYEGFLIFSLLYSLIFSPTLSLTNALAFAHLPDRDRDFGRVRVWGTIGWIAAGIGMGHWLLQMYTLDEPQAVTQIVERQIIDEKGREVFLAKQRITLKDASHVVGTVVEENETVMVVNQGTADAPKYVSVPKAELVERKEEFNFNVRPERLADVQLAIADLKAGKSGKEVTDRLLKFSEYRQIKHRGGTEVKLGDEVFVELEAGGSISGKLLLKSEKFLVVQTAKKKSADVIRAGDVASIRVAESAPLIDTTPEKDRKDNGETIEVKKLDGTFERVAAKDVVAVENYGVFTSDAVYQYRDKLQSQGRADAFKLSAILGLVMGCFCFVLPHTPPNKGKQASATAEALGEIRRNPLLTLFMLAIPISCIHQFYFIHSTPFVGQYQLKSPAAAFLNNIFGVGGQGLITIGQFSEIVVLGLIPLLAKKLSRKSLLGIGIVAYALRMFLFAYAESLASMTGLSPLVFLVLGISLHGVCFGCFIFVSFMVVDEETTGDVKASAQSLYNLVVVGIGSILGSYIASTIIPELSKEDGVVNYTTLFSYPMWMAIMCLLFLLICYPGGKSKRRALSSPQ